MVYGLKPTCMSSVVPVLGVSVLVVALLLLTDLACCLLLTRAAAAMGFVVPLCSDKALFRC